jgi:hypothetical protein
MQQTLFLSWMPFSELLLNSEPERYESTNQSLGCLVFLVRLSNLELKKTCSKCSSQFEENGS